MDKRLIKSSAVSAGFSVLMAAALLFFGNLNVINSVFQVLHFPIQIPLILLVLAFFCFFFLGVFSFFLFTRNGGDMRKGNLLILVVLSIVFSVFFMNIILFLTGGSNTDYFTNFASFQLLIFSIVAPLSSLGALVGSLLFRRNRVMWQVITAIFVVIISLTLIMFFYLPMVYHPL